MLLTTGSKIVYPSQGPCLIGPMIERIVGGQPLMFYQLLVLNGGGDLFIPVDKVEAVGIRLLLRVPEIHRLLEHLAQPVSVIDNYRQRHLHVLKLFASGSAYDLAEIVGSLSELNSKKSLSYGEHKVLERAKGLLVCEVAEVMETSKEVAEKQVDLALLARARNAQATTPANKKMADRDSQVRCQAAPG